MDGWFYFRIRWAVLVVLPLQDILFRRLIFDTGLIWLFQLSRWSLFDNWWGLIIRFHRLIFAIVALWYLPAGYKRIWSILQQINELCNWLVEVAAFAASGGDRGEGLIRLNHTPLRHRCISRMYVEFWCSFVARREINLKRFLMNTIWDILQQKRRLLHFLKIFFFNCGWVQIHYPLLPWMFFQVFKFFDINTHTLL